MIDVHARLIRHLEQDAGLDREIEFLPERRGDRRAQGQPPGPGRARARGRDGLLQDPPVHARCSSPTCPRTSTSRTTSSATSRRRSRSATASRCEATACAARSSPPSSPTSSSTARARRSRSGSARRPAPRRRSSPAGYAVAREVFDMRAFWSAIEALDNEVEAGTQLQMLIEGRRLVERATRWLVQASGGVIDIEATLQQFEPGARMLSAAIPDVLEGADREWYDSKAAASCETPACRRSWRRAWPACPRCSRCSTSSRSPRRPGASPRR